MNDEHGTHDRIDLHVYVHLDAGDTRAARPLDSLDARLSSLEGQVRTMAKKESDLQTDLNAIRDGVAQVLTAQQAQAATIADLKNQLAAGTPVSQDQLDALDEEAQAILASLQPLAGPTPGA